MNHQENERLSQMQELAESLWAGLRGLTALTSRLRERSESAEKHDPEKEFNWGSDYNAAEQLAEKLSAQAEALVCRLAPMNWVDIRGADLTGVKITGDAAPDFLRPGATIHVVRKGRRGVAK